MLRRWAGLEPRPGDRVELLVADASLARALFHGIPAARLLARARLASDQRDAGEGWDARMQTLLGRGTPEHERVKRATARHGRVAHDEGPLEADESTIAVLVWAVACNEDADSSLAEIAPPAGTEIACAEHVLQACAAHDERLATAEADRRAPAFEACVRLATVGSMGPLPWEQLRAMAEPIARARLAPGAFAAAPASMFPRRVDDEIKASDRRMASLDRAPLDALVARDPREVAAAVWREQRTNDDSGAGLATFLADVSRLLTHDGALVLAIAPPEHRDGDDLDSTPGAPPSWIPTEWTPAAAAALADALERGVTTLPRVRAAIARSGDRALDAAGAEMLHVGAHPFASAAFAEILARTARPRDVIRLVTYFAIAPDPAPAARALASCDAPELPRVLGAWLEAMLPRDPDDTGPPEDGVDAGAARVSACIAALEPYPRLHRAVRPLLAVVTDAPPPPSA
jgi:hypothetical protein